MNLVPTLEKWCANAVAEYFWANHEANQRILDAQNEGQLSRFTNYHEDFMRALLSIK